MILFCGRPCAAASLPVPFFFLAAVLVSTLAVFSIRHGSSTGNLSGMLGFDLYAESPCGINDVTDAVSGECVHLTMVSTWPNFVAQRCPQTVSNSLK
jgi:hypothetical protein